MTKNQPKTLTRIYLFRRKFYLKTRIFICVKMKISWLISTELIQNTKNKYQDIQNNWMKHSWLKQLFRHPCMNWGVTKVQTMNLITRSKTDISIYK